MAKIYETREDLQHDQLKDEAQRLKLKASRQDYWSLSMLGGGLVSQLYHERKPETRGWLSYLGIGLTIAGIVEWVRSWGTSSKADAVEMQSRFTGSGIVKMPMDTVAPEPECHHCHLQDARPKSLLEYAAKSASDPTKTL